MPTLDELRRILVERWQILGSGGWDTVVRRYKEPARILDGLQTRIRFRRVCEPLPFITDEMRRALETGRAVELVEELGGQNWLKMRPMTESGQGIVWIACPCRTDVSLADLAAIKTPRRSVSPREIDALEAVPASRYLVELLACDRATGRIVTRLADGPDLHTYANTVGQFPIAEAVSIGIDLCHALNVMHGVGYIHRDIKPLNVVKTARNAVLIDLGLAEDPTRGPLSIAGTPYYIAPEQFDSTVTPDAKADL